MADTTSISGYLRDEDGQPLSGITVQLFGVTELETVTDGNGYYVFSNLGPGRYLVKPDQPETTFDPPQREINIYAL